MIMINGVMYQEKQNLDEDFPSCSLCKVPLSQCQSQCKQFGNNYFFTTANPEDAGKDISGCMKCIGICGIIIAVVITLLLIF